MGRRGWTAEEADDFISEYGTGTSPMEVYNRERDDREEEVTTCKKCGATSGDAWTQCEGSCPMPMSPHFQPPKVEEPGGCPEHLDATHWVGFGLAGGGYGTYKVCGAEGCATIFDKTQWKDDEE